MHTPIYFSSLEAPTSVEKYAMVGSQDKPAVNEQRFRMGGSDCHSQTWKDSPLTLPYEIKCKIDHHRAC